MKKNILLVSTFVCLLTLCGCSSKSKKEKESSLSSDTFVSLSEKEVSSLSQDETSSVTSVNEDVISSVETTVTDDLFISEYFNIHFKENIIENRNNNDKALELYNPTSEVLDLSSYHIECYSNGQTEPKDDNYIIRLTGSLSPFTCYTIVNSWASDELKSYADYLAPVFIGAKSSVALFKNDTIIDVFGTIGASYNSDEDFIINGTEAAADLHNVVRKPGYTANSKFNESEWEVRQDSDLSTLGIHDKDTVQKGNSSASYAENAKAALALVAEEYNDNPCGAQIELIKEFEGFKFTYDFVTFTGGKYNNEGTLTDTNLEDGFYVNFAISVLGENGTDIIDTAYVCMMYVKA